MNQSHLRYGGDASPFYYLRRDIDHMCSVGNRDTQGRFVITLQICCRRHECLAGRTPDVIKYRLPAISIELDRRAAAPGYGQSKECFCGLVARSKSLLVANDPERPWCRMFMLERLLRRQRRHRHLFPAVGIENELV